MMPIQNHITTIQTLCSQHSVKSLYAFGSVLTDAFSQKSDIDLLVDFEAINLNKYAHNYFSLKFALEDTLPRPINLLEEKAIKNPSFKKVIKSNRRLIYGS